MHAPLFQPLFSSSGALSTGRECPLFARSIVEELDDGSHSLLRSCLSISPPLPLFSSPPLSRIVPPLVGRPQTLHALPSPPLPSFEPDSFPLSPHDFALPLYLSPRLPSSSPTVRTRLPRVTSLRMTQEKSSSGPSPFLLLPPLLAFAPTQSPHPLPSVLSHLASFFPVFTLDHNACKCLSARRLGNQSASASPHSAWRTPHF